jgi:NTE family protein
VLFKPTIFNGDPHNDGGLINNLPTDVFPDNYSTLLESEHGNCFSLIAFQFDNGVERSLLDQFVDRVYRENFLLNWVLEIVTGVKDTVSFWVKDRLKLLQYSNQTVLIPIGNVSATQLDVDSETQRRLFEQGYEAAENYIKTRYQWDSETDVAAENEEFMYTTFTSIEEAVYFCCHRQNRNWFERLALIANQQGMAIDEINALRSLHFNNPTNLCGVSLDDSEEEIDLGYPTYGLQQNSIFSPHRSVSVRKDELRAKMVSFEKIYPIFLRLPYSFLKNPKDIVTYKKARHSFSLHNLFACAEFLDQIQGEKHILLAGFIHLLKELENPDCDLDELCRRFEDISNILKSEVDLNHASYYGHWSLISRQYFRVFDEFLKGNQEDTITLCHHYSRGEEPMVTFVSNRLVEMSDEDVVSHRSATLM